MATRLTVGLTQRSHWDRLEELFSEAILLAPADRRSYVERACSADRAMRADLESLLRAHDGESGPLDVPPPLVSQESPIAGELAEGTRLGPWQVLHLIGRGGAGEVYAAVRADGEFQQTVAIKMLRHAAMAESTRFRGEREILARLEHSGIARLLDGGVNQDGRPYTVMEYVEGSPLTEYCRSARLDLVGRLNLFRRVCEVVAYAHRGLIVHRDLKPGNILVGPDGAVKLLDFGVAKLLDTVSGAVEDLKTCAPMTPDYAAPEQLTGQPVTTATDVYALGVVLFELLTDSRPWRSAEMPLAQAVRALTDKPPPAASDIARSRAGAPVAAKLIVGDLDAIVAKCLRKEPEHRYESVVALERDVQRFLDSKPVLAREGARLYVLGRFLRRHRWGVAAGCSFVLSLAIGVCLLSWQAHRIALERDIARRAATREEAVRYHLTRLFRSSVAEHGPEPTTAKVMLDRSAQAVLRQYRDDPYLAGKVVETLADLYGALEDVEGQAPLLEGFLAQAGPEADPEALALVRQKLANVELLRGHVARAAELLDPAEAVWKRDPRRYAEQRLEGLVVRGRLQRAQGQLDDSIATYQAAIRERVALSGRHHAETATLYNSLAITYTSANRFDDALEAYRQALAVHAALGSSDDLDALIMRANMGTLAFRFGRIAEAEELLRASIERQRALAGDSAAVAAAMGYYGALRRVRADSAQAVPMLKAAVRMATDFAGEGSPVAVLNRLFYAEALLAAGSRQAASDVLQENLALARKQLGEGHPLIVRIRLAQARLAVARGDLAKADDELRELVTALESLGAPAQLVLAQALIVRGDASMLAGKPAQAAALFGASVRLREELLWATSWELAEARERLGEALAARHDPHAHEMLARALRVLQSQLGGDHPLTVRTRDAVAITAD